MTYPEFMQFQQAAKLQTGKLFVYDGVKADIFSLGVTCFLMCTGRLPFPADRRYDHGYLLVKQGDSQAFWNFKATPMSDKFEDIEFAKSVRNLSHVLKDLLWGMLRHSENDRFSSLQVAQHYFLQQAVTEQT